MSEEIIGKNKRYRINVSTSVKGIKTWDATVEIAGSEITQEEVLAESDALIKELDKRYPTSVELKEVK